MTNHLQRIQAVEKEVSRLGGTTAVKEELTKLRSEMKKLYVGSAICSRKKVEWKLNRIDVSNFSLGRRPCREPRLASTRLGYRAGPSAKRQEWFVPQQFHLVQAIELLNRSFKCSQTFSRSRSREYLAECREPKTKCREYGT
jgi:hypothetical protein